jgi:hypothetical protein
MQSATCHGRAHSSRTTAIGGEDDGGSHYTFFWRYLNVEMRDIDSRGNHDGPTASPSTKSVFYVHFHLERGGIPFEDIKETILFW